MAGVEIQAASCPDVLGAARPHAAVAVRGDEGVPVPEEDLERGVRVLDRLAEHRLIPEEMAEELLGTEANVGRRQRAEVERVDLPRFECRSESFAYARGGVDARRA